MQLPDLILQVFSNVEHGVLEPILTGINGIAPVLFTIGAIIALVGLFAAKNMASKIGSLALLVIIMLIWPLLGTFVDEAMDYSTQGMDVEASQPANPTIERR